MVSELWRKSTENCFEIIRTLIDSRICYYFEYNWLLKDFTLFFIRCLTVISITTTWKFEKFSQIIQVRRISSHNLNNKFFVYFLFLFRLMKLTQRHTHLPTQPSPPRSWHWSNKLSTTSSCAAEPTKLRRLWIAVFRNSSLWLLTLNHWKSCCTCHCCARTRTFHTSSSVQSKLSVAPAESRAQSSLAVSLPTKAHSSSHKSPPSSRKSRNCWSKDLSLRSKPETKQIQKQFSLFIHTHKILFFKKINKDFSFCNC